jgi:hypothetical protein
MDYPQELQPTTTQEFSLPNGEILRVPKTCPRFVRWRGPETFDTYGDKPIVDFHGQPVFAELAILNIVNQCGWEGVWVDTFRSRFLTAIDKATTLPHRQDSLLQQISSKCESKGGCFDVFAWKGETVLFAESKRKGHDHIQGTQASWLAAALRCNLPLDSFLVVEWSLNDDALG